MTHAELVEHAAAWLRTNGYNPILTEPRTAGWSADVEIPDALGWHLPEGHLCLIECKVTIEDFRRDEHKRRVFRPRWRYYLSPIALDLPAPSSWGLIQIDDSGGAFTVRDPDESTISWSYREHDVYERNILLQALRKQQTRETMDKGLNRFAAWYNRVTQMVKECPGITAHRLAKSTDHPCNNIAAARAHLREACRSGKLPGIEMPEAVPTVFYPKGSTDAVSATGGIGSEGDVEHDRREDDGAGGDME